MATRPRPIRAPGRSAVLWTLAAVLIAVWLRSSGHAAPAPSAPATVAVGSKTFTESRILGEMLAQIIEARTELEVERRLGLGGTKMVFAALGSGEIDLYAEYTGTAWSILLQRPERAGGQLQTYLTVRREFEQRFGLTWLEPLGFHNGYAMAMRTEHAEELGITRLSDLRAHQSELRAAMSLEFLNREDGYAGLSKAYELELGDVRGMEHGLAYQAIASGASDLVDTYTTDAKILRYPIVLLEDDLKFFPPYDAAPVIRMDTLAAHPEIGELAAELGFRITDARMQALNYAVEEDGEGFATVAHRFLVEEGLLDATATVATDDRGGSVAEFIASRADETANLTVQHLLLTLIAVAAATAVAVPLGIVLTRRRAAVGPVIGAAGVIQTIPSLALLAFMIPVPGLGLGARSAVAALFLYALLPILRNTYTGIAEVDPDLIEAARGMGLRDGQILRFVQLPLATRTIMAGIRTSTVISIGVATLAAFIGAGGLGEPIITGLTLNDNRLILSGAIPAAVLAVVVDLLLGLVERRLTPPGIGDADSPGS